MGVDGPVPWFELLEVHRFRGRTRQRGTPGAMLSDERKLLENVGALVGFGAPLCRTKVFRHTYCSARQQTLDNGYPIAPWTVAKELGHGGRSLVDRVYGHLGEIRHRSEHLEYRVDQHEEHLGERLAALQVAHSQPG